MSYYRRSQSPTSGYGSAFKIRLLIAGAIVLFSVVSYMANTDINPISGKPQRVGGLTAAEEVALGMQSVHVLAREFGGFSRDPNAAREVKLMGGRLVDALERRLSKKNLALPYRFDFHLLDDDVTVNAFALPGGQVFITEALYHRLNHPGQLAGILGHEMGHVLERHSAQQMAKNRMFTGISSAAGVASGDISGQRVAQMVAGVVGMKYSRNHELESDRWGVELMTLAQYHPKHLLEVMDILESAAGSGNPPEFLSTHPMPENRREYINQVIEDVFPQGVPEELL